MYSQAGRWTAWSVASLCFFWLLISSYGDASAIRHSRTYHQPNTVPRSLGDEPDIVKRSTPDDSWRDTIKFTPAHQDPAQAPPQAIPEILELASGLQVNSNLSSRAEQPVNTGPLYCKDGPCIDGSCCGKQGICGYGPDYCGDGCTSQCNATAMCGEYSEEGEMPCGMKLCCSATGWCGTTEVYCHNADPLHGTLPCQPGYGSCAITGSPSCARGSGSSKGRTIGYYQSWNARERLCNKVTPKQLNTEGYTHLFYSFAFINPFRYEVAEAHPDDKTLMREFTDLSKGGKLKTWIAIGGFDMSEPKAATHKTWSEMVSSKARRATFIASVKRYMDTYGFTGVDLDWEYPGAPERGGNKLADTRNFSLLLKEMRAAYGTAYGISLTLAPDYWYLRWFDAKAMEPHVDFFGFMAYDLHGSWDADVKTLGKKVRGQADIREIEKNTVPLWFDGLNPAKINFGLALYGRGYTLADPSCSDLLCPFAGPSKPAPCTNFEGVMSLVEIEQLIKKRRLTPKYLPDSMMKQITWDDQWIGYDDEETFSAKRDFADGLCFGGTMIWSIDFQATGSGNAEDEYGEVVYLDPAVYTDKPAQCSAPCQFVLPPRALPSKTTISIPPYVTSIEIKPGTTSTITIPITPITTDTLEFYNEMIPSGSSAESVFTPFVSLSIRPVTTTITLPAGETQVRTLELPPWPAIVGVRPPNSGNPPGATGGDLPGVTGLPTSFPPSIANPTPTFDITSKPPYVGPVGHQLPTGTWPDTFEVTPVPTAVADEGDDDDPEHFKASCKLWFFTLCISWSEFNINFQGWEWNMPAGVWGPGPPPINRIKFPPGFTIKGTLPPWPKITVGPGGKFTPPPKPDGCTPEEASICLTTLSYATTVSKGVTKTTASQTTEKCATITGCHLRDIEATKTGNACKLTRRTAVPLPEIMAIPKVVDDTSPKQETKLDGHKKRQDSDDGSGSEEGGGWGCETDGPEGVIVPENPYDVEGIRDALKDRERDFATLGLNGKWREIRSKKLDFTALFQLYSMGPESSSYFGSDQFPDIAQVIGAPENEELRKRSSFIRRKPSDERHLDAARDESINATNDMHLMKRELVQTDKWFLSMMSMPEGLPFDKDISFTDKNTGDHLPTIDKYSHGFDDNPGLGQTIYIMDTFWRGKGQTAIANANPRELPVPDGWSADWSEAYSPGDTKEREDHGYLAAVYAAGEGFSLAPKANVVFASTGKGSLANVEAFVNIAEDISGTSTSVVSMVWGLPLDTLYGSTNLGNMICLLMSRMEEEQGVSFVLSGLYEDDKPDADWPYMCKRFIKSMVIVGATDRKGVALKQNNGDHDVWAPGDELTTPTPDGRRLDVLYRPYADGTSFSSPLVAGLVAYLRSVYTTPLNPADVLFLLTSKSRIVTFSQKPQGTQEKQVWNGYPRGPVNGDVCTSGKRGLEGRQSCEQPGNGGGGEAPKWVRGPPVEYKPGPPGPLCKENCGHLCSGYYCNPTPTGTPPDFTSPAARPSATGGNDNNDGGSRPGLPPAWGWITKISWTPVETKPTSLEGLPTLPPVGGAPSPTEAGASCVKSTTWTITGGPHGDATATTSGCASWELPKKTDEPKPDPKPTTPQGCLNVHVFTVHCNRDENPDSTTVQVWENGVLTCDESYEGTIVSGQELKCGNGARALVLGSGTLFKYEASGGVNVDMTMVDQRYDSSTICTGKKGLGVYNGWSREVAWSGGGDCSNCPKPPICKLPRCTEHNSYYDSTCKGLTRRGDLAI